MRLCVCVCECMVVCVLLFFHMYRYIFKNTLLSGILDTSIIIIGYFTYPNNSRLLVKNEDRKLLFGGKTSIPEQRLYPRAMTLKILSCKSFQMCPNCGVFKIPNVYGYCYDLQLRRCTILSGVGSPALVDCSNEEYLV